MDSLNRYTFTMFMVANNEFDYYIDRTNNRHRYWGLAVTLVLHGTILLLLWFFVLNPPNPPWKDGGITMSLGEENMGGPNPEPSPQPQPTEQYVPIQTQDEPEHITQETDEVDVTEKKVEKKDKKEIKPVVKEAPKLNLPKKEPERVVNQRALFKKGNTSNADPSGRGDGDIPGNEGRPDGDPNGDPDGRGTGISGPGTSGGPEGTDGFTIEMGGRKIQRRPNIEDDSRETGKVVVKIVVDRDGNVIKAVTGMPGTTTLNQTLLEKARLGAMQTKFVSNPKGADEQYGTMTFVFRFKP